MHNGERQRQPLRKHPRTSYAFKKPTYAGNTTITRLFTRSSGKATTQQKLVYPPATNLLRPNINLAGGTFTALLGPWVSRAWQIGSDHTSLGRWSYIALRIKDHQKLIILSGYRVCEQNPTLGSRTCYNQQLRLLTAAGHHNPNPRKQFFLDLTQQIQIWRAQNSEIIICLDLNEDTSKLNPTEDLGWLLSKTDLLDLHRHRHPHLPTPATHQCGSLTIDVILGSPAVAQVVTRAFYLPHGEPLTLTGDHRTLGVDLDATILFGNRLPTLIFTFHRGVNSNAFPIVPEFCKAIVKQCEAHQLFERIDHLLRQTKFLPHHHEELEAIDTELTEIIVRTDQKFWKRNNLPWSPTLHYAYLTHRYWMLCLTQKRTERNYSTQLKRIEQRLKQTPTHYGSINKNIRKARQELRVIQRRAKALRDDFLDSMLTTAKQTKDKHRQRLIYHLRQAELNRRCFAAVKAVLKPCSQGGLTHLKVPDNNAPQTWKTIDETTEIKRHLLDYCQKHFAMAHGSPFTTPHYQIYSNTTV